MKRCTGKHPLRSCQLDVVQVFSLFLYNHDIDSFPLLPELMDVRDGVEETMNLATQRRPWKQRGQPGNYNFQDYALLTTPYAPNT